MFKEVLLYCHVHIYIHGIQQYICTHICIDTPQDHFPPPTKANQPSLSKTKQTSSHLGKTLDLSGQKWKQYFIKYLQYRINYHKVFLCLVRSVRCFLFQSCVLLSPLCMVTSAEIQNLSFCNKRLSILSGERLLVLFN